MWEFGVKLFCEFIIILCWIVCDACAEHKFQQIRLTNPQRLIKHPRQNVSTTTTAQYKCKYLLWILLLQNERKNTQKLYGEKMWRNF